MSKRMVLLIVFALSVANDVVAQQVDLWVTRRSDYDAMPTNTFNTSERNFLNDFDPGSCSVVWDLKSPLISTCSAPVNEVFFIWGRFDGLPDLARITLMQLTVRLERTGCGSGVGDIINNVVYRHKKSGSPNPYDRWDSTGPILLLPPPGSVALATSANGITNSPVSNNDLYCWQQRIFLIGAVEVSVSRGFEGHLDLGIGPSGVAMTDPPYPLLRVWDTQTTEPTNPPGAGNIAWCEVAVFDVPDNAPGACCFAWGYCEVLTEDECDAACGDFRCPCLPCDPGVCPADGPGACCFNDGTCQELGGNGCYACGGTFAGVGTVCNPNPCPQRGACCIVNGQCQFYIEDYCNWVGGAFLGEGIPCDPNPCDLWWPVGACCFPPEQSCRVLREWNCNNEGGTYQGDWTGCHGGSCPEPVLGACCLPYGSCALVRQDLCVQEGGAYQGDGTTCGVLQCPPLYAYGWVYRNDLTFLPPARYDHAMSPGFSECLMYGGRGENPPGTPVYFDDTYTYNNIDGWSVQMPRSTPGPRYGHEMAYLDKYGHYLFGGLDPTQYPHAARGDLWHWAGGGGWVLEVAEDPSGILAPAPRAQAALACDTDRDVLLLFGGYAGATTYIDTWKFDGAKGWALVDQNGPEISDIDMAYDESREKMVLTGIYFDGQTREGTWEWIWDPDWSGGDWTQVLDSDNPHFAGGARLVYYGRYGTPTNALLGFSYDYPQPSGTARWNGTDWIQVTYGNPGRHHFHALVHVLYDDYLVLFGGLGQWLTPLSETWEMYRLHQSPQILLQPEATPFCLFSGGVLTAMADGTPDLYYRWEHFEGGEWTQMGPHNDATLILYQVDIVTWPPPYRCKIVNDEDESIYTNEVDPPLLDGARISQAPTPQTVCAGDTASFSVVATGDPPLYYQWSYTDDPDFGTWTPIPGAVRATLDFIAQSGQDGLYYGCRIANECGFDLRYAMLTVNTAPTPYVSPVFIERAVGQVADFSASVSGTPPFTYQWIWNGIPLEDGGRISGATSDSLHISQLHLSDTGAYSVVVTNMCGTIMSDAPGILIVTGTDCNDNGVPDESEPDYDLDGVIDECDNCPTVWNFGQEDWDGDDLGDACDPCPYRRTGDVSGDGFISYDDVVPFVGVLLDPEAASPDDRCAADMDLSGYPDGLDIRLFIDALVGG